LIGMQSCEQSREGHPEWLVGLGFRCSLSCLRATANAPAGEACAVLSDALAKAGLPEAILDTFLSWGLAVECDAAKPVTVLPVASAGFCLDECLAVSLVAASQHPRCPALSACALALLGSSDGARTLAASAEVASVLAAAGRWLDPDRLVQPSEGGPSLLVIAPSSRLVH
jgi:hypothetical protein